jgi:hypothetical protein
MATFIFAYRVPDRPLAEELGQLDDAARERRLASWAAWMDELGAHLVDPGRPVLDARCAGGAEGGLRIGGYSLVSADDLESALVLAAGCPAIAGGGAVEVGLLGDVPASAARRTAAAEGVSA